MKCCVSQALDTSYSYENHFKNNPIFCISFHRPVCRLWHFLTRAPAGCSFVLYCLFQIVFCAILCTSVHKLNTGTCKWFKLNSCTWKHVKIHFRIEEATSSRRFHARLQLLLAVSRPGFPVLLGQPFIWGLTVLVQASEIFLGWLGPYTHPVINFSFYTVMCFTMFPPLAWW